MVTYDGLGLILAFTSSAADACHEAVQKALIGYLPQPELAVAIKGGIIAIVFLVGYFQQTSNAWALCVETFRSPDFLIAWLVAGVINVSANFLMIVGMRRGKISDTVPYLSLSPIFLLGSGYIFLGELMDSKGMIGVATIALGGLWLSRASVGRSEVKPSSQQMSSLARLLPPGAGIYILIAIIQSVSSAFDKRGVRAAAAPVLYGATISSTVSLCSLLKFVWQMLMDTKDKEKLSSPGASAEACSKSKRSKHMKGLGLTLLACALKMVAYYAQLKANERMYSAHLSAIRKSGMLLVLLLGRLVFNEEVGEKWMPVSTMIVGVGLLAA